MLGAIKFQAPDAVEFEAGGKSYLYMPTRGLLYLNLAGKPVHQAAEGSFAFSEEADLGTVVAHARLLGARVRETR